MNLVRQICTTRHQLPSTSACPHHGAGLAVSVSHFIPRSSLDVFTSVRRSLDTFLGVFSGVLAFYMNETHPRTARPPEQRLLPLLRWKWAKYQGQRTKHLDSLETQ